MATTQTVIEAEAALAKARADALQQRVEAAKKELKHVRVRAKELRAEFAGLTAKITGADSAVAKGRSELYAIDARIAQLSAPLEDVLAEPENYEEELASLRAYRAEVLQKMQEAQQLGPCRDRQPEIVLELQRLEYTARNLVNIIEHRGKVVSGPEGGVSRVS